MLRNLAILAAAPVLLVAMFVATVYAAEGIIYIGSWILTTMLI